MSIRLILLFIGCLTLEFFYVSASSTRELNEKYAGQALHAMENLLNFFESDTKDLNLDGLYGLRIAQGQLDALQAILNEKKSESLFTDENHLIQSLSDQIDRIANQSLIEIARQASDYLHRFVLMASRPFRTDYEQRSLNSHWIESGEKNGNFDEYESDQCFGELLGSDDPTNSSQCYTSKTCWTMMTSGLKKDYCITHQLLWFLIAKNIGCLDHQSISIQANQHLQYLEDRFCTNIYQDAEQNYQLNDNQDLFLEQILLCSIIGYDEFLRLDWFQTILTWQDQVHGCFTDPSEIQTSPSKVKRHLLVEQEMVNGCLSHKSGLAAGVLASYIRMFLQ